MSSGTAFEKRTFCRICNAACGALVTVEDDQVVSVKGDRDHPISAGYLCPKGRAMGGLHHHPRRLNQPLIRRGDEIRPVSWDTMFDDLSDQIGASITAAGASAFGMYKGTAHYTETAATPIGPSILAQLGSRSWYTSLTVDCPAVWLVAELILGRGGLFPVPDVDAQLTVLLGTNPIASHGHTFNLSRPKEWLRDRAREGQLWVVDPRRSESADVATGHLAPRPASDYVLLGHLVRELLRDGADREYMEAHTQGGEALATAVEGFTLERVTRQTGIPAGKVEELLAGIRAAGRIAVVTGTGMNFQRNANVSMWLAWMLAAITGSLDRPGGMWFNPGFLTRRDLDTWAPTDGSPEPGPASRPELPGRYGELPCAAIVDEIEAGNLRSLVVLGGNPLIAWPQPERVRTALKKLEVLAVVDTIENEVTELATHVLPAAGQLERDDVPDGAETFGLHAFSMYGRAVFEPAAERRPTWWILARLARRLGLEVPGGIDPDKAEDEEAIAAARGDGGERWAELVRSPTAVVSLERPFGWVLAKVPQERLRLAPEILVQELAETVDPDPDTLLLISRRVLRKNNSTLSDGEGLTRPALAETFLHPADAAELGIEDETMIVITSAHGELRALARLDDRASRGTVSTPHGFIDVNASNLTSVEEVDRLTAMPRLTGLPVTVAPVPPGG
jgi:anaerobic selenocysteine-containing dehydrogenase